MIRACPSCQKKNRIPADHLHEDGRCGACKAELPGSDVPLDVDAASFDEIVTGARVPVLVDFWAEWCPPCRMAGPEVKKAAHALKGRALVLKVNTETAPELSARFQIRGIPNFMVFKHGQKTREQPGYMDARRLLQLVDEEGASARA